MFVFRESTRGLYVIQGDSPESRVEASISDLQKVGKTGDVHKPTDVRFALRSRYASDAGDIAASSFCDLKLENDLGSNWHEIVVSVNRASR